MALNAQAIPTARSPAWSHIYSGKWTDTTIRAILVNPIYAGDMVWNRRTDARFHKISEGRAVERSSIHGHRLVPNDQTDWIITREAHPALIDRSMAQAVKTQMDGKIQSIEQRGSNPRLRTIGQKNGRNWNGQRSRFILSGLLTCALCGSRYQGLHRIKGQKRWDGTRVKSYSYGCGGHIQKGNSVCQLNPIPQQVLEGAVIEAVLAFYKVYEGPSGRKRLAEAVRAQIGTHADDLAAARERLKTEQAELDGIINNLLDNLSAENREFVDKRLADLRKRREQMSIRDEELECLELAQASIDSTVGGHARQVDPSMTVAYGILDRYGHRILQLHISEVNARSGHDPLSFAAVEAFRRVADMIPDQVAVIIESTVAPNVSAILREVALTKRALNMTKPDHQVARA